MSAGRLFALVPLAFIILAYAVPANAEIAIARIAVNENRVSAGTVVGRTLSLDLDATTGNWFPDGDDKPPIPIEAFAERGHAPQIPGPLVRVAVGTDVRLRIRNTIAGTTLVVHNLVDLPSKTDRPIAVASGTERIVRIHAFAPGTFYYWATTTGKSFGDRYGADSQLSGAIVVDPDRGPHTDRIFILSSWDNVHRPDGSVVLTYDLVTINGRAWPATERLSYAQGANVRWRLINTSPITHPMHLHGFPFDVRERGDGTATRAISGDREVTERVDAGATSVLTWSAQRPGSWMFHCHLAYHIVAHLPTTVMLAGKPTLGFTELVKKTIVPPSGRAMSQGMEMGDGMGGMVLGVTIRPDPRTPLARDVVPVRRLTLDVRPKPGPPDAPEARVVPALEYVLRENGHVVSADGAGAPAIVLTRGVPVGINVVNNLEEPTAVHWHGIEIQDPYYDGPFGFANARGRTSPMVLPGATFEARFVPPRTGTFVYHTHMNDIWQLAGGLEGPLIVVEPGATFDPTSDHIVMLSTPRDSKIWGSKVNVNGALEATPIDIAAGTRQRLRLINLTTFQANIVVRLTATHAPPMVWTLRARDGIDLPTPRTTSNDVRVSIGQTRDLEFLAPHAGTYALEILNAPGEAAMTTIPLRIVGPTASTAMRP